MSRSPSVEGVNLKSKGSCFTEPEVIFKYWAGYTEVTLHTNQFAIIPSLAA